MKKIFGLIMFIVLMSNIAIINIYAAKNISIVVNGSYIIHMDVRPFIEDNRTLVPVRAIAEKMGAEILWDDPTQTVTINKLNEKITYKGKEYLNCTTHAKLVIGQKAITIGLTDANGVQVFSVTKEMDVAAKTVNGRTFIPARFVGYALGYDVEWNEKYRIPGSVVLEEGRPTVVYQFIGEQTIDFDAKSDTDVYDSVKRIDYEYDKEKYPEKIVVKDVEYPCRKGYDDIIIVDASHGRFEGTKMIDVFPFRWSDNNYIIECDDEKYTLDNSKTIDENLKTYAQFYTDKVGENVKKSMSSHDGQLHSAYYPEFLTVERATHYSTLFGNDCGLYDGKEYIDKSKNYYTLTSAFPEVNCTKMWYYNENPSYTLGIKFYGWKRDGILARAYEKNTLLFLNSMLGETGQRIWKMLNDYYTLSGHSYVEPETEWTEKGYYHNCTGIVTPEKVPCSVYLGWECINYYEYYRLPAIPTSTVEKYGLTVVDNISLSDSTQFLILKTEEQLIYIDYSRIELTSEAFSSSYNIVFEKIEK